VSELFATIVTLIPLPDALPVVLAAVAGACTAFGVSRLFGPERRSGSRDR